MKVIVKWFRLVGDAEVHFSHVLLSSCVTMQKSLTSFPGQRAETQTLFTLTYLWAMAVRELMLDILLRLWASLIHWRQLEQSIQPFLKNVWRVADRQAK